VCTSGWSAQTQLYALDFVTEVSDGLRRAVGGLPSTSRKRGRSCNKGRMHGFNVAAAIGVVSLCALSHAADPQPVQVPVSTEW
jgi:hypothetical protein